MYKRRNEVERLVRRLEGFRRVFSRFDKLDVMYLAFINFALIVDMLISVNTPKFDPRLDHFGRSNWTGLGFYPDMSMRVVQ